MSYSPTVYWASMVTPRLFACSATLSRGAAAYWRASKSPRRTMIWHGSSSKYSTSRGAE